MRLIALVLAVAFVVSCAEFQEVMDSFSSDGPVDVTESQPEVMDGVYEETEEEIPKPCYCD